MWLYLHPSANTGAGGRMADLCSFNRTNYAPVNGAQILPSGVRGTANNGNSTQGHISVGVVGKGIPSTVSYAIAGTVFVSTTSQTQGWFGFRGNNSTSDNSFYAVGLDTGVTEIRYAGAGQSVTDISASYATGRFRLLVSVQGSTMTAWVNGSQIGQVAVPSVALSSSVPFWVLAAPFNSTFFTSGIGPVNDVSVWFGRSFSESDAKLDYQLSLRNYLPPNSPIRWTKNVQRFGFSGSYQGFYLPALSGLGW